MANVGSHVAAQASRKTGAGQKVGGWIKTEVDACVRVQVEVTA